METRLLDATRSVQSDPTAVREVQAVNSQQPCILCKAIRSVCMLISDILAGALPLELCEV